MSSIAIDRNTIDTDVLVIGAGIGGLIAAISAAEQSVGVIVAERWITIKKNNGTPEIAWRDRR